MGAVHGVKAVLSSNRGTRSEGGEAPGNFEGGGHENINTGVVREGWRPEQEAYL